MKIIGLCEGFHGTSWEVIRQNLKLYTILKISKLCLNRQFSRKKIHDYLGKKSTEKKFLNANGYEKSIL